MIHERYIRPTFYLDADHPEVAAFARDASGGTEAPARKRAVNLYYAVRDGFRYNPYAFSLDRRKFKASFTLAAGEGFCVQKAILLAAAARAVSLPARLGFANVRNHLATERLKALMGTDLFVFHGYTEMMVDGRWVKATPAFNLSLCEKFDTRPLDFDGVTDSIFHPYDNRGRQHMEYVHDYGAFDDFPYDKMIEESRRYYPAWFHDENVNFDHIGGDFEKEREDDRRRG
ncbi:MAG: transglutaminase family protein [Thermodesulfobacteriota bacterium]